MKNSNREEDINKIRNKLEIKFNKVTNILEDISKIAKSIDRILKLMFWVIAVSILFLVFYSIKTHPHLFDKATYSQKTHMKTK